jgi:hypothetical protein
MTTTISKLIKARLEIQPPKKEGTNPHFRSKYVTLEGCIEAVTAPLAKHGFFMTQEVIDTGEGRPSVCTKLYNEEDPSWSMVSNVPLVLSKQDMQGLGSAITYARRYGIMSLLNLPAEDDDGNGAISRGPAPSKPQGGGAW